MIALSGSKRARRRARARWAPCCWYCQPTNRRRLNGARSTRERQALAEQEIA